LAARAWRTRPRVARPALYFRSGTRATLAIVVLGAR
jgi:hypothetical protein